MDIYSLEQIGQAPKQGCLLMYTRKKVIFEKYDCIFFEQLSELMSDIMSTWEEYYGM